MNNQFKVTFAGAADSVTGSRHLVDVDGKRILLDCGLFQGFKALRLRNWAPFAVLPRTIDAVVLSHAHLDHSGYLPVLTRDGFEGPIYCTRATRDLAEMMLLDSAHLLVEEAEHANRYGYSKHKPAKPLYTVADVQHCMHQFVCIHWDTPQYVGNTQVILSPAGHLLGAAIVTLLNSERRLVFTGDLGRENDLLMAPPVPAQLADVLLMESTYGNRLHPKASVNAALATIIKTTAARGGMVLMPSFAVGRAQAILLCLSRLKKQGAIPNVPVFLDSPMAYRATLIHKKHAELLRISAQEMDDICNTAKFVATPDESKQVSALEYPSIIIAGSGMATGGRILHHLKAYAPDAKNAIVFPGFQVPGTRGAKLLAGDRQTKIHGHYVTVNAKIHQLEGLSGHADADGLMQWLRHFEAAPRQTYIVHGERDAADTLRLRITDELHWPVSTVEYLQSVLT